MTAAQTGWADSETVKIRSRDKLLRLDSAAVAQVAAVRAPVQEYSYSVVEAEEDAGGALREDRKEWMRCGVRSA